MLESEDIPEINKSVADIAGQVISFALLNEIKIESVDRDVLGGVAIYLSNEYYTKYEIKSVWVSLLNNGTATIINNKAKIISSFLNYDSIMNFLFSD